MSDDQPNPYAPRPDGTPPPPPQPPTYYQPPPVPPPMPPTYQPPMPPAPPPGYYAQQPPVGYPPGYVQPGYGQPAAGYGYGAQTPTASGKATAVLVLGIVGIVTFVFCIGFIPAIVGLCIAPGAKREIRASNGWRTGEGVVKAGVICCWVAIGLFVAVILLIVAGAITGDHTSRSTYGA